MNYEIVDKLISIGETKRSLKNQNNSDILKYNLNRKMCFDWLDACYSEHCERFSKNTFADFESKMDALVEEQPYLSTLQEQITAIHQRTIIIEEICEIVEIFETLCKKYLTNSFYKSPEDFDKLVRLHEGYVVNSEKYGVFVGSIFGGLYFSKTDCVGQSQVPYYRNFADADKRLNLIMAETGIQDLIAIKIKTVSEDYATVEDCIVAGLHDWRIDI